MNEHNKRDGKVPPAVHSRNPEPELEDKLRDHPEDEDTKVDVGSDESMDASDPSAAVQPKSDEPVPSSGYPQDEDQKQGR